MRRQAFRAGSLIFGVALVLASGLSASGVASAQGTPGGSTGTPSPLCALVSAAQFGQIVGSPIDTVQTLTDPGTSPISAAPGSTQIVGCQAYASGTPVAAYGFDSFDSAADADAFYTSQKQQLSGAGAPITDVSGLGDMAFYSFSLFIAKGPVVIIIVPGDNGDQAAATQLAQLVIGAV